VRRKLLDELQGLDPAAILSVKKLIRAGLNEKNDPDAVNLRESYGKRFSRVDPHWILIPVT